MAALRLLGMSLRVSAIGAATYPAHHAPEVTGVAEAVSLVPDEEFEPEEAATGDRGRGGSRRRGQNGRRPRGNIGATIGNPTADDGDIERMHETFGFRRWRPGVCGFGG